MYIICFVFFVRPFVKRFALCYQTVVCLSVLSSVTLVYSGQTVRWINTKLVMQVDLGPGHTVLDGDPASPPQKGGRAPPQFSAHFYCDQTVGRIKIQDATWYGGRPQPRRLCVRWRPIPHSPKRGRSPNFRHMSIVAKRIHVSAYHLVRR